MTSQDVLVAAGASIFGALVAAMVALTRNRQDVQTSFRDSLIREVDSIRQANSANNQRIDTMAAEIHRLQLTVEECVAVRNSLKQQVEQLTREVAELTKRLMHYETE